MSRQAVDKRRPNEGGRIKNFMRIARLERGFWHRSESPSTNRRLVEFMRIARGRMA